MSTMKKVKKVVKSYKKYGMIKIKGDKPSTWITKENKHGWSLGLKVSKDLTIWLKNVRFKTFDSIDEALSNKAILVTFPLKNKE